MKINPKLELEIAKCHEYNKINNFLIELIKVLDRELVNHINYNKYTKSITKYICTMELIFHFNKTRDENFIFFVFQNNQLWNVRVLCKCFERKTKKMLNIIKLFLELMKSVSYLIKLST